MRAVCAGFRMGYLTYLNLSVIRFMKFDASVKRIRLLLLRLHCYTCNDLYLLHKQFYSF